jgi:thiol-disulfide isomerase/thioredoxin
VRSDTNLNKRFAAEGVDVRQYGAMPGVLDTNTKVEGQRVLRSHSFSGREPNSLFYNRGGERFSDLSGISGLDSISDGRAFAYFDYDRDGRVDVALTNTNDPQLQLFRNEIPNANRFIKVRLIGGNRTSESSEMWSPRDGYGANVSVEAGEQRLWRELRCGDGFAAQNSRTLTIGIGDADSAEVVVGWPSGKRSEIGSVPAGSLLTVYENPEDGQSGHASLAASVLADADGVPGGEILELGLPEGRAPLVLVVNMATWCAVCREEIPHLRRLATDAGDRVAFYGLAVDPEDSEEKLAKYRDDAEPPYQILADTGAIHREAMGKLLKSRFGDTPLPSSVLLDGEGRVLKVWKGTPTLSDLR